MRYAWDCLSALRQYWSAVVAMKLVAVFVALAVDLRKKWTFLLPLANLVLVV